MSEDGQNFLNSIGGLLTHAWTTEEYFSEEELDQINVAIHILINVCNGGSSEYRNKEIIYEAFEKGIF